MRILQLIARSSTDLPPVLNAVAENAARLCDATDALIFRVEGDNLIPAAHCGPILVPEVRYPLSRGFPGARAVIDQETIHVHDIVAEIETNFPDSPVVHQLSGVRTILATPLLAEGSAVGAIVIRRTEVRPFAENQVSMLETFADQAVIAIENVRLFKELEERNRDLTEALEQQTATSEILRVIASSPTDIQPTLDVIAENAARVCGADNAHIYRIDGEVYRTGADYGPLPKLARDEAVPVNRESVTGRAIVDQCTVHVHDIESESDAECPVAKTYQQRFGDRTRLATPLVREGVPIGAILIRRMEVRPFTNKQIKLLETFADQAVIAIENVRLFQELKESLEQQTVTSEILGVIASSPTDIQPVLNVVAENAAQLCEASDALIYRKIDDTAHLAAHFGPTPGALGSLSGPRQISRGFVAGRAMVDRKTIHVDDILAEIDTEYPEARAVQQVASTRTMLATPLLRQGEPIGSIAIRRTEVRPFTDTHIRLLETFAHQAVIAIENVRLFQELEDRNRDLTEALEQADRHQRDPEGYQQLAHRRATRFRCNRAECCNALRGRCRHGAPF